MVAKFSEKGELFPLGFHYANRYYQITAIKWWRFGGNLWGSHPSRIYCVCTRQDKIAELEWSLETGEWILLKIG